MIRSLRLLLAASALCMASQTQAQLAIVSTFSGSGGSLDSIGTQAQMSLNNAVFHEPRTTNLYVGEGARAYQLKRVNLADSRVRTIAGPGFTTAAISGSTPAASTIFNAIRDIEFDGDSIAYVLDQGLAQGNANQSSIKRWDRRTNTFTTLVGTTAGNNNTGPGNTVNMSGSYSLALKAGTQDTLYFLNATGLRMVLVGRTPQTTLVSYVFRAYANLNSQNSLDSLRNPRDMFFNGDSLFISDAGNNRFVGTKPAVFNPKLRIVARIPNMGPMSAKGDTIFYAQSNSGQLFRYIRSTGTNIRINPNANQTFNTVSTIAANDTAIYVGEPSITAVRYFHKPSSTIRTLIGGGRLIDGNAQETRFQSPGGAKLYKNRLYITDVLNNRIRLIDTANGVSTTFLQGGLLSGPQNVLVNDTVLYVSEYARNGAYRISKINLVTGRRNLIAGRTTTNPAGAKVDGDSTISQLRGPAQMAFSRNGRYIYFGSAAANNEAANSIGRLDLDSFVVRTIIGPAAPANPTGIDNGPAADARFNNPAGVAMDGDSVMYIADNSNDRIRRYDFRTGIVSTVAGGTGTSNSNYVASGTQARLLGPSNLVLDTANRRLWFTDHNVGSSGAGAAVKYLDLTSRFYPLTIVAGSQSATGLVNGVGTATRFNSIQGIAINATGNVLYVVDQGNERVRKIRLIRNTAPTFSVGIDQRVRENAPAQVVPNWATNITPGSDQLEAGQRLTFTLTPSTPALFRTQPTVDSVGTLRFEPAVNAYGTTRVAIRLRDNGGSTGGGIDSAVTQFFNITIDSVNNAPFMVVSTLNQRIVRTSSQGAVTVNGWASGLATSQAPNLETRQRLSVSTTRQTNPNIYAAGGSPRFTIVGTSINLTFTTSPGLAGTDTVNVVLKDNGGIANGGVDTFVVRLVVQIDPYVNRAPTGSVSTANQNLTYLNTQTTPISITNWATALAPSSTPIPAVENNQTLSFSYRSTNTAIYAVSPAVTLNAGTVWPRTANLGFRLSGTTGRDTLKVIVRDNGGKFFSGVDSTILQTIIQVNPNSINDQLAASPIVVFPNPFSQQFVISTSAQGNAQLQVLNQLGQVVRNQTWVHNGETYQVDMTDMPSGIYIAKVTIGNRTETHKVTKQ